MGQFDSLSIPDLSALISELEETRRIKKGLMPRSVLQKYLDVNNPDFMGSGMTFQEFMMVGEVERIRSSYSRQTREEKSRRRDAMVALTIEYTKILQQTHQATMWAREAIVEVLNGDWKEVKVCRDMLTFEGDFVGLQSLHGPIFARFVEMLDEVLAGVPKEEEPEPQAAEVPS